MATIADLSVMLSMNTSGFVAESARATSTAERLSQRFVEQANTLGLTGDQLRVYNAAQRGASQEAVQAALSALRHKDAVREEMEATRRAAAVIESTRTPLERYDREVAELTAHLNAGRIQQDTFARAVAAAGTKYGVAAGAVDRLDESKRRLNAASSVLTGGIGRLNGALLGMVAAATAAMGVNALAGLTQRTLSNIEQQGVLAKRLGMTTEALSTLSYAANLADAGAENLVAGVTKMNDTLGEAQRGTKAAKEAFTDIGLDPAALAAGTADQAFIQVSESIANLESASARATAAVNIFGRGGQALLPLMLEGASGIKALQDEARAAGRELTAIDVSRAGFAADALDRLGEVVQGGINVAVIQLAPLVQAAADEFVQMATAGDGLRSKVLGALDVIGSGLGVVADVAERFYIGFKQQQAGWLIVQHAAATFGSTVTGVFSNVMQSVADLLRMIPGIGDSLASAAQKGADVAGALSEANKLAAQNAADSIKPIVAQIKAMEEGPRASERIASALAGVRAAADAAAESMAAAGDAMPGDGDAAAELAQNVADATKKLQEQIDTFKMSSRQAEIWKLEQAGAGADVIAEMRRLDTELTALEAGKQAADNATRQADSLREALKAIADEAAAVGKSSIDVEIGKLQAMGATDQQVAEARAMLEKIDLREKELSLIEEGVRLAEQANPAWAAQKELEKSLAAINAAERAGALTTAQADAATDKLLQSMEKTTGQFAQMTLSELQPYLAKPGGLDLADAETRMADREPMTPEELFATDEEQVVEDPENKKHTELLAQMRDLLRNNANVAVLG